MRYDPHRVRPSLIVDRVEQKILLIRGHRVMLDSDLARLYGVETRALIQAVKRNPGRFPADFTFRLTSSEQERLRSQIVISNGRGGRRYAPYAFTEQGVAMLSSVLHSERAIRVNVEIMRAFVRLRAILSTHKKLARKLEALERRLSVHDDAILSIMTAIRQLMDPPEGPPDRRIGFGT